MRIASRGLGIWIVIVAILVAGCATKDDYVKQSVQANLVIEDVSNQILLLNVVRAYKRRPMHFSTFERVGSPSGIGATTQGITVPFGPDATGNYPLTLGLTLDRPSFNVLPLDKQEFTRGFTSPVPLQVIGYYFDQGWPRDLLMHLFFRQIDVLDANGKTKDSFVNYPQNPAEMEKFQRLTAALSACRIRTTVTAASEVPIGPVLRDADVRDVEKLAKMSEQKLTLKQVGRTTYQLNSVQQAFALAIHGDSTASECGPALLEKDRPFEGLLTDTQASTFRLLGVSAADSDLPPGGKRALPTKGNLVFHIRSPEAIVYYLGEVTRAALDGRYDKAGTLKHDRKAYIEVTSRVPGTTAPRLMPLFKVMKDERPMATKVWSRSAGTAIKVIYDGETFMVPTDEAVGGRTMHVLSLVSQLIGLQKSATDLPATSTIQLVR